MDDEWDQAMIDEIDKIVEQATAKPKTQVPPPLPPHSSRYVDDWDAGAQGMQDRSGTQQRCGQTSNKPLNRIHVAVGEKRKYSAPVSVIPIMSQTTLSHAYGNGNASVTQNSDLLRTTNQESSGCALLQPSKQESQAEILSSREPTASVQVDFGTSDNVEVMCELRRLWCPKARKQATSDLLASLFATCEKEIYMLLRAEDSDSSELDRTNSVQLQESFAKVRQGVHSIHSLVGPLLDFLDSESTLIVQSTLHVFRCLLTNRQALFDRIDDAEQSQVEAEGYGWKLYTDSFYGSSPVRWLGFSSSRIQCKLSGEKQPRSGNEQTCKPEEKASPFLKRMLRLALQHKDSRVKLEALSLIRLLLVQTNPLHGRLWYGSLLLQDGLVSILANNTPSDVQLEVVRILYLLFNCAKFLERIMSDVGSHNADEFDLENAAKDVLDRLCACIMCKGESTQDYNLRKCALQTVNYLMSTSTNGVSALVQKLGCSSITAVCISVLDSELAIEEQRKKASSKTKSRRDSDERPSLLHAALTMLYRLGTHKEHSSRVISYLTQNAEAARNSLNLLNRLVALQLCFSDKASQPDMAKHLRRKILNLISAASVL